jgi:hypothetical protein
MGLGPLWTGAKHLVRTGIRSPDLPAHSELLYRLCYPSPHVLCSGSVKCVAVQKNMKLTEHTILKPTKCTLINLDVIYCNICRLIQHVLIPPGVIIRDLYENMNGTKRTNNIRTC